MHIYALVCDEVQGKLKEVTIESTTPTQLSI